MITSMSNARMKELVKLQKSARERKKKNVFISEGIKLTKEAYACGRLKAAFFSEKMEMEQGELLKEWSSSCEVEVLSNAVFKEVSDTVTPQGILGVVEKPQYSLDSILSDDKKSFLLLDDLRDPGNLGTIMRTAEGAGMSGVILSKESVDLFNPKTVRSTMGAIFRVPFYYAESLLDVMEELKGQNISVYGTLMEGSLVYDEVDYTKGAAIVIGNEANGISDEVIAQLTGRVRIPMGGKLESLNAAVSAAILMYEVSRQKRKLL